MELEGSLPCLMWPTTGLCPEADNIKINFKGIRVCIGFNWLKIWLSGRPLWTRQLTFTMPWKAGAFLNALATVSIVFAWKQIKLPL